MRSEALLGSTSARLSLVYAALIVAAFVSVGVLIWFAARNTAETALREDIELEVAAIRTELESEGLEPAIAAIRARAEHPGAFEYLAVDAEGRRLVGDFPPMDGERGWHRMTIGADAEGAERREDMLILTELLPGGIRLSVGDDLARARAVQNTVLATLASIGGAAVVICLVVGVLVTRRILSRMQALDETLTAVAAGDVTARFPARAHLTSDVERIGQGVNAMLDRIEQLVGDVRRVSRDVAHDLRTPLTRLEQRLEQAESEADASARLEAIEAAQREAGKILEIFDALIRLSEIEAGAARRPLRAVALVSVVEKVVDAYGPDVEDAGKTLELGPLDESRILGDPDLLTQALANLVENSMRHTPPGTLIVVSVRAEGGEVVLEVADAGGGIAPEHRDRVLEPFVRLDKSRTTPGSGLGLSMVAAIARFHGARIVLGDAAPGLGVQLRFPSL